MPRQSHAAAAAFEPHEHGLGLVAEVVARGDAPAAVLPRQRRRGGGSASDAPRPPSAPPDPGPGRPREAPRAARRGRCTTARSAAASAGSAPAVVEVGEHERQRQSVRPERGEQQRERRRVRARADGHEHPVAGREEVARATGGGDAGCEGRVGLPGWIPLRMPAWGAGGRPGILPGPCYDTRARVRDALGPRPLESPR